MAFNFTGIKQSSEFNGYIFQAMSTNGRGEVTSYIAIVQGKRVYGRYNYQSGTYVEERAR